MRVIAFCGPKGCGKDTAASVLFKHNLSAHGVNPYFCKASFAAGVKNFCTEFFGWTITEMDDLSFKETPRELWAGGPTIEPRRVMQDVANWLRDQYGPDVHVQRWLMQAGHSVYKHYGAHVITDLRFPNELAMLERLGKDALVVYIQRPEAETQLKALRASGDTMATNVSESHYDKLFGYAASGGAVIVNNGGLHKLEAEVHAVVANHFGHWKYWD